MRAVTIAVLICLATLARPASANSEANKLLYRSYIEEMMWNKRQPAATGALPCAGFHRARCQPAAGPGRALPRQGGDRQQAALLHRRFLPHRERQIHRALGRRRQPAPRDRARPRARTEIALTLAEA